MSLRVLAPGLLTTVQDRGRDGWRHLGVARCGALDTDAAWLANRLVGNGAGAAVLEITLQGPRLQLLHPARIALAGATLDARFADLALPGGRPLALPAGELHLGAVRDGVRAWLAIAGGIDVAPVLGSRSTDLRGGFGGLDGRALETGDVLPLGMAAPIDVDTPRIAPWWIDPQAGEPDRSPPLRYVPSAHPLAATLGTRGWRVDPRSNRQGVRLAGDALSDATTAAGISEPVAPGTIQLPPDGQPIVLLADAQTVGGYPKLGHVIAADLPRLAQVPPHAPLRLVPCDAEAARHAACLARARLARIELALSRRAIPG